MTLQLAGQSPSPAASSHATGSLIQTKPDSEGYVLGPQDSLLIRVMEAEEITDKPYPIDLAGNLELPRVGKIHAAGLTVDALQEELTRRFSQFLKNPIISVSVAEFRSEPIFVLGEVTTAGVHQLSGRKTLFEVISEAGGLKPDAGNSIKITRRSEWGNIPLPHASLDSSGRFSVADINVNSVMNAQDPQANIAVRPYDTITVPKAEMVYVVGAVKRSGGFVLSETPSMSVLAAISLAEGLEKTAKTNGAKILRPPKGLEARQEIPVDIKKLMEGKLTDIQMLPNDILFVPNSTAKSVSIRALEAIVQTGTGLAIYRPF